MMRGKGWCCVFHIRHSIIGSTLRDDPAFCPPCFVQLEKTYEIKPGDRVGPYDLPPGMRTARELSAAIPGSYVREHEPNVIVIPATNGGTYGIEVPKMLDVIRQARS